MKDSIIQSKRFQDLDLFDSVGNMDAGMREVDRHHVFMGVKQRELADEDGLWVSLTRQHHENGENPRGIPGRVCSAHSCRYFRLLLQMLGQIAWEKQWYKRKCGITDEEDPAREGFLKRYGKKYL